MAIIETHSLRKTYHTGSLVTPVLHGIHLVVEPGEFVAIMGPSGCGKSTLLYVLGLMASFDGGMVLIEGRDVGRMRSAEKTLLRRERLALVFQRFNLLPALTAEENVELSLRFCGASNGTTPAGMLDRVGLAAKRHHRPRELSMGEQQRVAIARSLVGRPAILLADEPTGNLDSENSGRVLDLLAEFNRELGQTILMVTHDCEAAQWAHRTITMRDGRFTDGL
jgi:putative ABC transport system ATP-binding protein